MVEEEGEEEGEEEEEEEVGPLHTKMSTAREAGMHTTAQGAKGEEGEEGMTLIRKQGSMSTTRRAL